VAGQSLGLRCGTTLRPSRAHQASTSALNDPHCQGTSWRVLAAGAAHWDVQVYIPEVALLEAVAGYQRDVDKAQQALQGWAGKYSGRLGLTAAHDETQATLTKASASYPDKLRGLLDTLGATILPPPDTPHLTLVERAVNRRRPCDDHGNGYRDTLNWLTLLDLASQHTEERIVWVSDNTHDFGTGDDNCDLHDDLAADLTAINAHKRVSWVRTLQDLVLMLAEEHAPGTSDLSEIHATVQQQALSAFISADILTPAADRALGPPPQMPPRGSSCRRGVRAVCHLVDGILPPQAKPRYGGLTSTGRCDPAPRERSAAEPHPWTRSRARPHRGRPHPRPGPGNPPAQDRPYQQAPERQQATTKTPLQIRAASLPCRALPPSE